ncbi:MAG: hypothetical protein RSE12_08570 [Fuscovulum sp.]|nr:MAG: hypothetical protein RSE12_08570 [Fuscovulum sp.]
MPHDVVLISFLASSLFHDGWPIEVGLATVENDEPVIWSSLIRRQESWPITGWSFTSQEQHQISLETLAGAPAAADVASQLLSVIWRRPVVSATPRFDSKCLARLFAACDLQVTVQLIDWDAFIRAEYPAAEVENILSQMDAPRLDHRVGSILERMLTVSRRDGQKTPANAGAEDLSLPFPFGAPHQTSAY